TNPVRPCAYSPSITVQPPVLPTSVSLPSFSQAPPTTHIYPLSLHDALPIFRESRMAEALQGVHRAALKLSFLGSYPSADGRTVRSEEHTSELQSRFDLVCRLLLEKKNQNRKRQLTSQHHRIKNQQIVNRLLS